MPISTVMRFYCYNLTTKIAGRTFLDQSTGRPLVVSCLNPHSFVTAQDDPIFQQALINSDILLPDGIGICGATSRWKHIKIRKIAGDDFHLQLLNELDKAHGKIFYMGSSPVVLKKIEERLRRDRPNITVATHSPSYCKEFSKKENDDIISQIETFAPDALMVGLTAPKQEKWVYNNLGYLKSIKVIACIGGAFDFYAGTIRRASSWAISHYLEWLVRLVKDPVHMWQRNFISTPKFLIYNILHHKEM